MAEKLLDAPLLTPAPGALLDALLGDGDAPGAPPAPPRVYAARWWVLLQYVLFTALQGWAWAIPGSVSDTYLDLYAPAVDSWTIQVFLNYGAVLFCLVAFPVGYAMDKPGGIKQQVLLASALVTAGAVLRCCATDAGVGSVVCLHASFILTALAGPAAMSAVAKLSEEWFPPNERTTATSVATLCNGVGTAFSSLVGPAMVAGGDAGSFAPLQRYNYVMLALIAANLLMMAAYFPAAPPTPPSASAAVSRAAGAALTPAKLWGVLRAVARNRNVVVLALVYGVGGGAQAGWGGLLNMNLNTVGVSQYSAGMIGFVSALVGNMAGVVVGAYADRARAFKRLCVGGSVVGALATAWIVAALQGALPAAWSTPGALTPGFFLAFTLTYGTFATSPLLFELAVESTHPLPEGSVITCMTFVYNAAAAAMLTVPLSAGAAFNYAYLAVQVAMLMLLVVGFRETFDRYSVDVEGGGPQAAEAGGGGGGDAGELEGGNKPFTKGTAAAAGGSDDDHPIRSLPHARANTRL